MSSFNDFNLNKELYDAIAKFGFESPTPIQESSIPPILQGRDVLGESATGSGKTLAFGCGIMQFVEPKKGLQALVITPTRELAQQVTDYLCTMSNKLKIVPVYGGVSINPQIDDLRHAEVVVSTPGRFKDHLQRGTVNTTKIRILVLDEADRMLDMGFIDDIEFIIKRCPVKRQTLFFSATMPPEIERMSRKYLQDPVRAFTRKHVDPSKLKQMYYDVPRNLKFSLLLHLLSNETAKLVMVFCNTRRSTDVVVKNLRANGIDASAIHGGLTQNKRTRALDNFKTEKATVLVCTDVAARGLHVDNISHIYNYEIPPNPIDYVHRIGRTARAGEEGKVVNLVHDYDHDNFSRVLNDYRNFIVKRVEVPPDIRPIIIKRDQQRRGSFSGRRDDRRPGGWRSGNRRSDDRRPDSRGSYNRRPVGQRSDNPRSEGRDSDNRRRYR